MSKTPGMLRHVLFITALLLTLLPGACTSAWKGTNDTLKAALGSKPKPLVISRSDVYSRPYFQILVQTGLAESVLILTRVADRSLYWQTTAGEMLVISDGLVQRTTGLAQQGEAMAANLEQTRFIGSNPFATGLHNITDNSTAVREIDLDNYRHGITVSSVFHVRQEEPVVVLGDTLTLLRVDETVKADSIRLSATNTYWVDETGFIWKSVQTLWPGFTVTITQLRPYRKGGL